MMQNGIKIKIEIVLIGYLLLVVAWAQKNAGKIKIITKQK